MDNILFSVIFIIVSGAAGYFSYITLVRRNKITSTPTSSIHNIRTGTTIEVSGYARRNAPLVSPFTQRACVFYKYTVERYQRHGKHSNFVTVAKGDSSFSPFILNDKTGQAFIDARKAALVLEKNYEFINGFNNAFPANLVRFMEENGITYKGWLGESRMRFREWVIREDEQLYVLGTAYRNGDFAVQQVKTLHERIQELKNSPGYQAQIDTDHDGRISEEEWSRAVKNIEEKMLAEQADAEPVQGIGIVVAKGEGDFIISDKAQDELVKYYNWQIFGGIAAAVVAAMVAAVIFFYKKG